MQTQLQFTAGNVDADGTVLAVNCYCFYTDDKGPNANPVGALWRILPADKVPAVAELAKAKLKGGSRCEKKIIVLRSRAMIILEEDEIKIHERRLFLSKLRGCDRGTRRSRIDCFIRSCGRLGGFQKPAG